MPTSSLVRMKHCNAGFNAKTQCPPDMSLAVLVDARNGRMVKVASMSAMAGLREPNRWFISRKVSSSLISFTKASSLFSLRMDLAFYSATISKQDKKGCHGFHKRFIETTGFWQHDAPRRVVAPAVVSVSGPFRVCHLFDLGRVPG